MPRPDILFYTIEDNDPQYLIDVQKYFGQEGYEKKSLDVHKPLEDQFRGVEMVVDLGGWATREMIDAAKDVKLWQILGTGLDHTDVGYMLDKNIRLSFTPGSTSACSLGECGVMFMLMLARYYPEVSANFRSGIMFQPNGRSLKGRTLGILGFGGSGRELARLAKPLGMRIEAIDIVPPEQDLDPAIEPDFFGGPDEMDHVISHCDYLSLHLHLTPKTHHLIDRRRLSLMKPGGCLINMARGDLVDEDALAEALLKGELGGAALDVFSREPPDLDRPEYQLPNVVLTNHISGNTDDTIRMRTMIGIENARRLVEGGEILHPVTADMGLGKYDAGKP
jgi:phosphoglycerate dehydrogenase-like enzyme